MPKHVPQTNDNAALVINGVSGGTQIVITAIAHSHGVFLQLVVIRRGDYVDGCLLGSRLGESISKTRNFTVTRLDHHLQYGDNLL